MGVFVLFMGFCGWAFCLLDYLARLVGLRIVGWICAAGVLEEGFAGEDACMSGVQGLEPLHNTCFVGADCIGPA